VFEIVQAKVNRCACSNISLKMRLHELGRVIIGTESAAARARAVKGRAFPSEYPKKIRQ